MRRFLILTTCFAALGVTLVAQDDADFKGWMQSAGGTTGSLGKNLAAKNGDGTTADAKKLQEVFGHVNDYFAKKKVDDAAKLASDAQSGFGQVADLAAAGKFDEASAAMKKATSTCAGCHSVHREKAADGSWKMK